MGFDKEEQKSSQQEASGQEINPEKADGRQLNSGQDEVKEKEAKDGSMPYYAAIGAAVAVFLIAVIFIWQAGGKTISETLKDSENGKKTENSVKKEDGKATDDAIFAVTEELLGEPVRIVSEAAISANTKREQLLAEASAAEEAARKKAEAEAKAKAKAEAEAKAKAKEEAEKAAREQAQTETSGNSSSESTGQSDSDAYVPTPTQPVQSADSNTYIDEVIRLVNIERANAGLPPLAKNVSACQAANTRAGEIVTVFDHVRPDGRGFFSILDEMGIFYAGCGENIALGYRTPEEVVQAWMNSPGHRANILKDGFEEIGVSVAEINGTFYWVQLFIKVNW